MAPDRVRHPRRLGSRNHNLTRILLSLSYEIDQSQCARIKCFWNKKKLSRWLASPALLLPELDGENGVFYKKTMTFYHRNTTDRIVAQSAVVVYPIGDDDNAITLPW